MNLRQLGKSGLMVSELGMGSMTFGGQTPAWDARQIMDQYVHHGGNFLDTSNSYHGGKAEEIIGQWMTDGGHRPHIILSTQTYLPEDGDPNHRRLSRHAILYSVEQSLRRLQTDYIDLYAPQYWDSRTPLEETLAALELLLQQGKIRYVACANFTSWQVMKTLSLQTAQHWSPMIALHAHYSLLERGVERETIGLLAEEGLGLLAWSPLAGGFLTGKFAFGQPLDEKTRLGQPEGSLPRFYRELTLNKRGWHILATVVEIAQNYGVHPACVALRWVLSQPQVAALWLGISQIPQIDQNLAVLNFHLTEDDLRQLDEAASFEVGYPNYMPALLAELLP